MHTFGQPWSGLFNNLDIRIVLDILFEVGLWQILINVLIRSELRQMRNIVSGPSVDFEVLQVLGAQLVFGHELAQ